MQNQTAVLNDNDDKNNDNNDTVMTRIKDSQLAQRQARALPWIVMSSS